MNLYFRLIILWLRIKWIPESADPLSPTTLTMHVMPNDLDVFMHMNNGRYLTIMDLGRLHLMACTGLLKLIIEKRWSPLLGSVKIHFLRPLKVFQRYTLTTQTVYWDEKWIYLEQKMESKGELCATALLRVLFIGQGEKITPQQLLSLLPHPPEQPAIPDSIKYWQEAEVASRQ